jgi:hypothetical protein
VLYSRPGCGLCDEAREVLLSVRRATPFDLREVDVSADAALEHRYGVRIPVVEVNGEELFELAVDRAAFASAVGA